MSNNILEEEGIVSLLRFYLISLGCSILSAGSFSSIHPNNNQVTTEFIAYFYFDKFQRARLTNSASENKSLR